MKVVPHWPNCSYIPMLNGHPLFEVALASGQVTNAIAANLTPERRFLHKTPRRAERQFRTKRPANSMQQGTQVPPSLQGITNKKPPTPPRRSRDRAYGGRRKRSYRKFWKGPSWRRPNLRQCRTAQATALSHSPAQLLSERRRAGRRSGRATHDPCCRI
jgi:hypothetical protein